MLNFTDDRLPPARSVPLGAQEYEMGEDMYCPNCGIENTTFGLRYCKACGANLNNTNPIVEVAPGTRRSSAAAAWAIALATTAITLGGLGITFGLVEDIARTIPGVPRNPAEVVPVVIPMIIFGSMTVFLIVFMLIRLFTRLMNLPPEPKRAEKSKPAMAYDYRPHQPTPQHQQIPAPPVSVTEHTTRNFDPIPSMEQKARE